MEIEKKLNPFFDYEIIFVNDGSIDGTQERILEVQAKNRRIRYIKFQFGKGQTEAFDAGFKHARGDFIATMDGDGQNDPADLLHLFQALNETDMVCGYRRVRKDSWKRRLVSKIANTARNRITGEQIRDVGCSMRIFRRRCLKGITLYHGMHRFLPTMFRIAGYRFIQKPVNHRPRLSGDTKYGTWDRFKEGAVDLFAVRWIQRRKLDYDIVQRSDEYGLEQNMADHRFSGSSDVQCQISGSMAGQ